MRNAEDLNDQGQEIKELKRQLREARELAAAMSMLAISISSELFKDQFDALTGLPGRRATDQWLEHNQEDTIGVVFIDLNGFKKLNDTLGHARGDECLRQVAKRLVSVCRSGDMVLPVNLNSLDNLPSRRGGDEFVIYLKLPAADLSLVKNVADRAREAIAEIDFGSAKISAAIGVAVQQDLLEPIDEVTIRADAAMYEDKRSRRHKR